MLHRKALLAAATGAAVVLCAGRAASAALVETEPIEFGIFTFDDWTRELGPGGHLRPIPTWDAGLFERDFPGQSSAFRVPTLTALPNLDGEAALEMGFPGPSPMLPIIGGLFYDYDPVLPTLTGRPESPGPRNLTNAQVSFSVHKRGTEDPPAKYSFTMVSWVGGVPQVAHWEWEIPERQTGSDAWDTRKVNIDGGVFVPPAKRIDRDFDITRVTGYRWDYAKDQTVSSLTGNVRFDHFNVTPEPAVVGALAILAAALLPRRRRTG